MKKNIENETVTIDVTPKTSGDIFLPVEDPDWEDYDLPFVDEKPKSEPVEEQNHLMIKDKARTCEILEKTLDAIRDMSDKEWENEHKALEAWSHEYDVAVFMLEHGSLIPSVVNAVLDEERRQAEWEELMEQELNDDIMRDAWR